MEDRAVLAAKTSRRLVRLHWIVAVVQAVLTIILLAMHLV